MDSLTELFCLIDDFCQTFEPEWEQRLLADGQKKRRRPAALSLSELMTLAVLFHQLRYRQFKSFYLSYAVRFLRTEFPGLPSYQRCLELMPRCAVPLSALFAQLKGRCTGITIVDSSPLAVCDNLRISRHRVFAKVAARGKSSTGWFYGLKLHALLTAASTLPNVTVNQLHSRYPDGKVDVDREQQLLLSHDVVVLQFPFYWYSTPALLKEWQDAVLAYGFAYGPGGDKLKGKKLMIATTTGGPAEAYQAGGYNQFSLSELLRPLQATANLAGMAYQTIFSVSGTPGLDDASLDRAVSAYCARLDAF